MMDIFRKMEKSDSKGKITFFMFFLLISFLIQTVLPRFVSIHHDHEGGRAEHQHVGLQFKPPTKHSSNELDHHNYIHQRSYAQSARAVDSNKREIHFRSALGNTGHDHHDSFFLGKFTPETSSQQTILSCCWHETFDEQDSEQMLRLAIHIRGPPLSFV